MDKLAISTLSQFTTEMYNHAKITQKTSHAKKMKPDKQTYSEVTLNEK